MRAVIIDAAGTGRFDPLARGLVAAGHTVTMLTPAGTAVPEGVGAAALNAVKEPEPELMAHVKGAQQAVRQGQEVVRVIHSLGARATDLVVARAAEGTSLFVSEVCAQARVLLWCDGLRVASNEPLDDDAAFLAATVRRAANMVPLLAATTADWLVTGTVHEARTLPAVLAGRLTVLHRGVDRTFWRPRPAGWSLPLDLGDQGAWAGDLLLSGGPLLTLSCPAPGLRAGLPELVAAVGAVLATNPRVRVALLAVGSAAWPDGETLAARADPTRFGMVRDPAPEELRRLLWASVAHVAMAPTQPLWDTPLRAMACGVPVVGGGPWFGYLARPGISGFPVPSTVEAVTAAIEWVLAHPAEAAEVAATGVRHVEEHFDERRSVANAVRLAEWVAGGGAPAVRPPPPVF